ncbi:MAG: universal stress protein [Variovorax sp.]|nr:MAG: universal stress protein [Variovorax sp.]
MTPRSILAVTDFSMDGDHALNRAALLSAAQGATLKLVYLAYPGETPPADAATRLAHHALQLSQVHGIAVHAASRLAHQVEHLLADVAGADLVVWGTAPVRSLRSFFLGQPVEALIRKVRRPVLVVRGRATHAYRRVLVAVDFSQASAGLVDLGFALGGDASVELFHAVSTANEGKLRYAEVSDHAIKAYRDAGQRQAQGRMFNLTDSYVSRRNRVQSAVAHGDPARQTLVQQQRSGSELIVVGKHPASIFEELIFSSVAGRLLSLSNAEDARADALVVPHDWQPASRTAAARRLTAGQPTVQRVRAGAPPTPRGPNPAAVHARA